jgi:hypothetical protein
MEPVSPGSVFLLLGFERVLAQTAVRTDPIFRDLLPGSSGSHTVFRISHGGIIDITANADVLHQPILLFKIQRLSTGQLVKCT